MLDLLRYSRGGAASLFFLSKTLARYDRINHEPALQHRGEQGINYLSHLLNSLICIPGSERETQIMVQQVLHCCSIKKQ